MPYIAGQCYVVVHNCLHKRHHLYRYKVYKNLHVSTRDRNMCMSQKLVTHHGIVLLNPTKNTSRN